MEGGFLTNSADIAKLTTDAYRQQLANAIGEGIMQYRQAAGQQQTSVIAGEPRA
ncbi:MAG: N-acetylmuramoyl-L-alanine amidase [Verrucomicrobiota bacterium]|nr:N-acetylmuramoyl-L-alanine amidase [Verrucomicrobiota bacterium]